MGENGGGPAFVGGFFRVYCKEIVRAPNLIEG